MSAGGIAAWPEEHTACIVDNSVWQRLGQPEVRAELEMLTRAGVEIVTCAPQLLEYLLSARSGSEYATLLTVIGAFRTVEPQEGFAGECVHIQQSLWNTGKVRAVGNIDIEIAVTAMHHRAVVLHYDGDFGHIRSAWPKFSERWAAPQGSLPH